MAVRSVTATAPGKINLCLRVGALRDDGYHDLATVFQAVSLVEEVTATPSAGFTCAFSGPIDVSHVPLSDDNLVIRAARAIAAASGYDGGVHLEVIKRVPIAGGMGGGSADAAAALVAVDALWQTHLGKDALMSIAADLGSDVPFSMVGGTAIGLGRGEELSPVLATGHFEWVLVPSDHGLSTPTVYRELDRHRDEHRLDIAPIAASPDVETPLLQALRGGDPQLLADYLVNDLQVAALHLQPELGATLEFGESHGALAGIVSGSGPTTAFLMPDSTAAMDLVDLFTRRGQRALRVLSPVHGARLQ